VSIIGILKGSKDELLQTNKEFLAETLNGCAILHDVLSRFIENKLNKDEINGVIESERKCDRLKEKYVQILFKDKRALPFLVEDRYNILMMIDKVNDLMEFLARFLKVNPFPLFEEIKEEFSELCDACAQSVEELVNCASFIETDFDAAYKLTFKIEELKRQARNAKFDLLEKVYQIKDEPTRVYLISKLVTYIYDITSWVEETSDYLRGLIIKYPSR
jgi:predicted phosphate transport protein (TIGR00153 family)